MANEIKTKTTAPMVLSLDDMIGELETTTGKKIDLQTSSAIGKRMMAQAQALLHGNNAVLLVDCSGSMEKNMAEARKGAHMFVDEALKKRYHVGVVGFGCEAFTQAKIKKTAESLHKEIDQLDAKKGTTNMTGAFDLGVQMLQAQEAKAGVLYMVTDGMPNDRDTALEAAQKAKTLGYEIMCMGTEWADHDYLKLLATRDELAEMCKPEDLKTAIGSMAGRLPALAAPKKKKG